MANEYAIKITIDGASARREAARIRGVIEREMAQIATVKLDTSALEKMLRSSGKLDLSGNVEIAGLTAAAEQIQELHALAQQPLTVEIAVQMAGLNEAREAIGKIREDAGALGRAVASGLGRQADALERHLTELQSRITGLVRAGQKLDIDAPLDGLERMGEGLDEDEKKTYNLYLKMKQLSEQSNVLNKRFAELSATKVQPLGGGGLQTLEDLFRAFDKPHVRYQIRRAIRNIDADKELQALAKRIEKAEKEARAAAEAATTDLVDAIDKLHDEMNAKLAEQPPGMATLRPDQFTDAQRQWQAEFGDLTREFMELNDRLQAARTAAMTGDADNLKEQLIMRRQKLEAPLREEHVFWREWAMESVDDIVRELRYQGQNVAADALAEMYAIWEQRKAVETQMKRGRGRLVKGAQAELPKDAKGTMVDFISSERVLERSAQGATAALNAQYKSLSKLIARLDQAAMAADGLSESERMAYTRMQQLAAREIKKGTPLTKTSLEEAGGISEEVLVRLSKQAKRIHDLMSGAAEEIAADVGSPEIEAAAERPARGIVALWQRVRDVLVGHSVIPEMVDDINRWLAQVGAESPFAQMQEQGALAADTLVDKFSRLAEAIPAQAIDEQISILTTDVAALEREFERMSVRGSEASQKYIKGFEDAAAEVRRVLGDTPEVNAKLAQGMLPRGFGIGSMESTWQRGGAVAKRGGEREGDAWYQALHTDIDVVQRLSVEDAQRMDALWEELASKQAQLAALLRAQLAKVQTEYSAKLNDAANAPEFERLYQQLDATGREMEMAEARMREAVGGVSERVAAEMEQEAEAAGRAAGSSTAALAAAKVHVEEAKTAGRVRVEEEKRITLITKAEARKQSEALKIAGRVRVEEERRQTKALDREMAQRTELIKTAGKVEVENERRITAVTKQELRERERAEREAYKARERAARVAEQAQKRLQMARGLATEAGVEWDRYVQGALDAGRTVEEVVGALRRLKREQYQAQRGARQLGDEYKQANSYLARLVNELNQVRTQNYGIGMLITEAGQVGRSMQFAGTAMTGSLVMAGKSYLDFARETDTASRSLLLGDKLTQQMRSSVIALAGEIGMLDPQEVAKGVTVWAQATGQAVDSTEDMNEVLKQTVPIQQLAALTGVQMGAATDGVAATLRQFGLNLDDTSRVVAIFNKVADDTLAEVGDISESFKFVGPQAAAMGEQVEDTAAILGVMADKNIRGSQAGRAYRQMLISLIDPTKEAREQLTNLFGTDQPFVDAEGKFVGLAHVIDMLSGATAAMTDAERDLLLSTMFTSNALPGVTALVTTQTEAREHGINAMRAESKLLRGVVDDEVSAYGRLKEEQDGTTIAMMGALDLWERQLQDYTDSDVARVSQMQIRWKTLWLAIGKNVTEFAMPGLREASDLLVTITDLIQNTPAGKLVSVLGATGAGTLAIGTLISTGAAVARAVAGLKVFVTALERTAQGQTAAGTEFRTAVEQAGARFAEIVTGAADTAAATEIEGAEAETAVEIQGAETEAAVEQASSETVAATMVAGAGAEEAVEIEGAVTEEAIEAAGGGVGTAIKTALAGIGTTAVTVGGGIAATGGLVVGGAGYQALANSEFGQEQGMANLQQYASVLAYGIGKLVGGTEKANEWFLKVADALGQLNDQASEGTLSQMSDYWSRHRDAVLQDRDAVDDVTDAIWRENEARQQLVALSPEQKKAADLYVEMLKKQAEETEKFNDAVGDALSDLNADLAKLARDHNQEMLDDQTKFDDDEAAAVEAHNRQIEKQRRDHDIKMQRMEEDHLLRMGDLIGRRDALGVVREMRQYDTKRRQAEEDFNRSQGDAGTQFKREQDRKRAEHDAQMREAAAQYEEEKRARQAEYEERVGELEQQHQDTMDRLSSEYFDKINSELHYFKTSQLQQNAYQAAMLQDARTFLAQNRGIWNDYYANLPVPSAAAGLPGAHPGLPGETPGYQSGGYIPRTGAVYAHAGEFVLSSSTVNAIERGLGPLTQEKMVAGVAGGQARPAVNVTVRQDFAFHGSFSVAEREWFRREAYAQAQTAVREVLN